MKSIKLPRNEGFHSVLVIGGISVDVFRKDIKNLHINVMPPNGRVRVAIPFNVNDDRVRSAVITKFAWIKKQQAEFENQPRQSPREMVEGESHYLLGRRYRLKIIDGKGQAQISTQGANTIVLAMSSSLDKKKRLKLLDEWYREQLRKRLPDLFLKWQSIIGVEVAYYGIRKMKTKWGSCNIEQKRILLNSELIKKPVPCIEYILVHELVHILERKHNKHFKAYMDQFMPDWEMRRDLLNNSPLVNENWSY